MQDLAHFSVEGAFGSSVQCPKRYEDDHSGARLTLEAQLRRVEDDRHCEGEGEGSSAKGSGMRKQTKWPDKTR